MDPITVAAIFASAKVKEAIQSLANDAIGEGKQALIRRLHPSSRERAAKQSIQLFAEEWNKELEDKCEFTSALPGYRDQLTTLIETAAAEIAEWMEPEIREIDLRRVETSWVELKLDELPEGFDWKAVARNYAQAIRIFIKRDPELRAAYDTVIRERTAAATERTAAAMDRIAPLDPGFDLSAYRKFIIEKKCNALQLAVMHSSTYEFDRKVTLWSVFVPQSARESAPIPEIPPELQRRLREEGHLTQSPDEQEVGELSKRYQSSPIRPVLEILDRNPQVVVVGDPGSGKTSLLKYLALQWAVQGRGPIPLLVDLKEYVKDRRGILQYCQSGCDVFRLNAVELQKRLQVGQAAFYLDGLDEIFDAPTRQSVIEEIVVLSASYSEAPIVVTSRKVGYEPEQLRNAGFLHATLEEFDLSQMLDFLRQWHRIAEVDDKERSLMHARLERALQESTAIRELAGNPLLLTMMAILNRNQELPRNRVALYREASRVLLDDWDARKALPVGEFDREDKESLLREIAGDMQQAEGGLAGNLIEESRLRKQVQRFLEGLSVQDSRTKSKLLVRQLTERNFILSYAGADRFSFVHRTFLEFYCAAWFVDRFQKKQDLTLEQLKTEVFGVRWKDQKWHEVLRLIAGMVEEKKAEELILFLMDQDGRNEKLANLILAAGCLSEVRNRRAIHSTGQALWERFAFEVIRYDAPHIIPESSPFGAFLSTQSARRFGEIAQRRQLAVRTMASVWKGENAGAWLRSVVSRDPDWIVRQSAVQELARGWKDDLDILPLIRDRALKDKDNDVRQSALQELARGWKDDPETLPWLRERAQNDNGWEVRESAVKELARGWKDDPATLPLLQIRAQSDEGSPVREAALQELARSWKDDPDTLRLLHDRIQNDESNEVRRTAIQELARGWRDDPSTLALLHDRARNDESWGVRQTTAQEIARAWKDDPGTLPLLLDRARNDDYSPVRWAAARELARGWKDDPETLPLLHDCARNDEYSDVRQAAIRALAHGWKDNPGIVQMLRERAQNDEHPSVRQAAIQELTRGWTDDPEITEFLLNLKQMPRTVSGRRLY